MSPKAPDPIFLVSLYLPATLNSIPAGTVLIVVFFCIPDVKYEEHGANRARNQRE